MQRFLFLCTFVLIFTSYLHAEKLSLGLHKYITNFNTSQKDFHIAMQVFIKEITDAAGVEYAVVFYEDITLLAKDFHEKKVNLVVAEPLNFIKYFNENELSSGLMAYKTSKEESLRLLVLGRKDDKRDFNEKLRGALAFNEDMSIDLFIKTLRLEKGIKNAEPLIKTTNHQQSILKLFFKKADLALVDLASYQLAIQLNPQIKENTVILQSIPLSLESLGYFHKDISDEFRKKIFDAANYINNSERGNQFLMLLRASKIDFTDVKELDSIRELQKRYTKLLSQGK
jgi:hypothetical protein